MIAAALAAAGGLWARITTPVLVASAIIAALLGAYVLVRQSGRDAERATIAIQETRNDQTAARARREVDGLGDRAISDRLRQYQRQ